MKNIFVWIIALSVALTICLLVQGQTDLEQRIEQIFLQEHGGKDKLAQIGSGEEVQVVLLRLLVKHKHAEPGTKEYLYLRGATRALGTQWKRNKA